MGTTLEIPLDTPLDPCDNTGASNSRPEVLGDTCPSEIEIEARRLPLADSDIGCCCVAQKCKKAISGTQRVCG